jgi:hypothetical protein
LGRVGSGRVGRTDLGRLSGHHPNYHDAACCPGPWPARRLRVCHHVPRIAGPPAAVPPPPGCRPGYRVCLPPCEAATAGRMEQR